MNRERIEKLRDFLRDEVTDAQFDMQSYLRGPPGDEYGRNGGVRAVLQHCGSTACIAGWAVERFAPNTKIGLWKKAEQVLGLTEDQSERLFEPATADTGALYRDIPRARAVATLTRLLETGEVDWGQP